MSRTDKDRPRRLSGLHWLPIHWGSRRGNNSLKAWNKALWYGPERARERTKLRQIVQDVNANCASDNDDFSQDYDFPNYPQDYDFPNYQHRHRGLWWYW